MTAFVFNNNKLKQLSRNILLCKNLTTLDLGNNDLGDIPRYKNYCLYNIIIPTTIMIIIIIIYFLSEIGCLNKLVRILLEGNPLKCIRSSIKMAGAEQLKQYLKSRIEGDITKLEE